MKKENKQASISLFAQLLERFFLTCVGYTHPESYYAQEGFYARNWPFYGEFRQRTTFKVCLI